MHTHAQCHTGTDSLSAQILLEFVVLNITGDGDHPLLGVVLYNLVDKLFKHLIRRKAFIIKVTRHGLQD